MNSNSFVPIQVGSNIVIQSIKSKVNIPNIPWQLKLFDELSSDRACEMMIDIDDLLDAYESMMISKSLVPLSREWILKQLNENSFLEILQDQFIGYQSYHYSLKWFVRISNHYEDQEQKEHPMLTNLEFKKKIEVNNLLIFTTIIDIIVAGLIILIKINLTGWLLLARSSAAVILTNIAYLLIPFTSIPMRIPDRLIVNLFQNDDSDYFHKVFGFKILIFSIVHTIGHIGQITYALNKCRRGCDRDSINIVPKSSKQIAISYGYFSKQYPYITGIILIIIFSMIVISLGLFKMKYIRYSTNQLFHKSLARIGIIMTIAHGCSQLLGLNISYIFTLPLLIAYLWNRKYEMIRRHITINRWLITPSTLHLYLQDDRRLNDILKSFENVSIYINYSQISSVEWHPFTLMRGYNASDAILSMKRVGKWTNNFASSLTDRIDSVNQISIGHYSISKFRLHRLYKFRYFFCSGIGITGFMSSICDMLRTPMLGTVQTTLIWSVNSIDIINEFSSRLIDIQNKIQNIKILIYYSNRSKKTYDVSYQVKMRFLYLQRIIFGYNQIDIILGLKSSICCSLQRVDFIQILRNAVISAYQRSYQDSIGVFVCGSKEYADRVKANVNIINKNSLTVQFVVWSESL